MNEETDYINVMAQDHAVVVASPRLSYSGRLNVPADEDLPVLFSRDGTYYWPRTFSFDLFEDELDVDLINVPDAVVNIESIVITQSKEIGVK